jgi:hypothetical protein
MAAQVTLLSSTGTSPAIVLNPVAKATTIQLTVSGSSGSGAFDIQMTLDDPTTTPAPTLTWAIISSAAGIGSGTGIFDVGGLVYTVVTPIGGVRLHSTTAPAGVTATLKALQSVTA